MPGLNFPLSNVQIELMKLYSTGLREKDMQDLKSVLGKFYAGKAISQANEIWDQRKLTDEDMDKWLNEKS